jgi:hypothetical protein
MLSRTLAPIKLGSLLSSISELLARSWSVLLRDATGVDCGKLRAFAAACDTTLASRDGNGRPLAGCSCWSAYLFKVHYLCTRRRGCDRYRHFGSTFAPRTHDETWEGRGRATILVKHHGQFFRRG